jgi:hypothetical protein
MQDTEPLFVGLSTVLFTGILDLIYLGIYANAIVRPRNSKAGPIEVEETTARFCVWPVNVPPARHPPHISYAYGCSLVLPGKASLRLGGLCLIQCGASSQLAELWSFFWLRFVLCCGRLGSTMQHDDNRTASQAVDNVCEPQGIQPARWEHWDFSPL